MRRRQPWDGALDCRAWRPPCPWATRPTAKDSTALVSHRPASTAQEGPPPALTHSRERGRYPNAGPLSASVPGWPVRGLACSCARVSPLGAWHLHGAAGKQLVGRRTTAGASVTRLKPEYYDAICMVLNALSRNSERRDSLPSVRVLRTLLQAHQARRVRAVRLGACTGYG